MCLFLMAFKETAKDAHGQSDLCTFIAVIKQKMKLISGDSGYFFFLVGLFQAELVQIFQSLLLALFFFFPLL